MRRQRKPDAELARGFDGFEPLHRVPGHGFGVRRQKVSVGLAMGASDAAAQLVQLGEPELVRSFDDDRIGVGDVDTVLDDGRAHQHVELTVIEVTHDLLEFAFGHLSVTDTDACLGHHLGDLFRRLFDGPHFIVQIEHLSAAHEFAADGFADDVIALFLYERVDRQALGGRRGDDRQVANAADGHVEGAGNGRGSERHDVDLGTQRAQAFFLPHAETVFFVDDHESEVFETEAGAQQLVCADEDIETAARQTFARAAHFGLCLQSRHHFDVHRPIGKAVAERLEVLLSEQRGRYQHDNLLVALDGYERCAHGDLGLAESDVAANEPVGGFLRCEVVDHGFDGTLLILGYLERELVVESL